MINISYPLTKISTSLNLLLELKKPDDLLKIEVDLQLDFKGGPIGFQFIQWRDFPKREMSEYYSHYQSSYQNAIGGRHSRKEDKDLISGIRKQHFEEIREQCAAEETLFEDPEFPAEDSSIFFSREPPRAFEWKRPHVSYLDKNITQ